jgi:hypothetical protein
MTRNNILAEIAIIQEFIEKVKYDKDNKTTLDELEEQLDYLLKELQNKEG